MAQPDPSRLVQWLAARLGDLRRERGLTLEEIAERSGVDRSYVGLLEKGKRRPTLEVALRLCRALGPSLQSLLDEAEAALSPPRKRPPSRPKRGR